VLIPASWLEDILTKPLIHDAPTPVIPMRERVDDDTICVQAYHYAFKEMFTPYKECQAPIEIFSEISPEREHIVITVDS
jgi:hypothetical protein